MAKRISGLVKKVNLAMAETARVQEDHEIFECSLTQLRQTIDGDVSKLDPVAQKLFKLLVARVQRSGAHDGMAHIYRLTAKELEAFLGQTSEDIAYAAKTLLDTLITIRKPRSTTRTGLIASYKRHLKEGWFEFGISPHLEQELLLLRDQVEHPALEEC
ncbi:MAG: hypothetical protein CSYNP_03984 [Syntrophus sp. SKADARSKE-3]|nr:hypothetical protein [Syntrophus sp. SKADARSKE-3]